MELRQINTFVTLAALNSFTQTAEKLGYTQPSITSQIQLLEQELGVKLFERFKKNIYLTAEGEAFLNYAKQIIQLCEDSKLAMTALGSSKKIIRIGTLESLASSRLSGLFKDFRAAYPEVELVIKIADSNQFLTLLQENKIDVAFYLDLKIDHPELSVLTCASEPLAILAAPEHPIHQLEHFTEKNLAEYPLILSEDGCSYRKLVLDRLQKLHITPGSIMEIGSTQAIRQMTMSGLGITILPKIAVSPELEQNTLLERHWEEAPFELFTQVVCYKDKWISPILEAFLEMAKIHLEGKYA